MKLSIYSSLRSIGWAVTEANQIIDCGIKRLNISFDNYYEYIAGLPVTKRINKRLKAQARRNLWRYKSRRASLQKFLIKNGFPAKLSERTGDELLRLRVNALTTKLVPDALAHVFLSLQTKRGYKSLRGVSDNEHSEYLQQIEAREIELQKYPSVAAYLLTLESRKNVILRRESYEAEFRAICKAQEIAPEIEAQLFKIIYYQRPLKKPPVSFCKFERNRKVVHASHPQFQYFRCWRDANNIAIYDPQGNEIDIPFELREKWQRELFNGTNITKARCLKDLGVKKNVSLYRWFSGKQLVGYQFQKDLKAIRFSGNIVELWNDLFSATEDERLRAILQNKYQLDQHQCDYLIDLNLNSMGHADYSMKAISKLIQHLQSGMKLSEAILHVYGKVEFEETHLRNVLLEQNFQSTKSLVEAVKKHFNIDEVVYEIDPLLKMGNKARKEASKNKRKNEKWEKENATVIAGRSSYDVLKYQLWQQQGGVCIYTGVPILPEDVFSDVVNIDHIVPKSKIFERSPVNEVLTFTDVNQNKGRMTGIDFAESLGNLEAYLERVNAMPEGKQRFLLMREADIPTNYLSAKANDYNTKCYGTLHKGAVNIPNKLLNRYYREWGFAKYGDGDARQALAKAFCMSNFCAETVAFFDNLKDNSADTTSVSVYDISPDISAATAMPQVAVAKVFMPKKKYSKKTAFGYCPRGSLHAETVYGLRHEQLRNAKGELVKKNFFKVRQPVSKLTPNMVKNIMDESIKRLIEQRIAQHNSHEDALASMVEHPPIFNGKAIRAISIRVNSDSLIPLRSSDGKGKIGKSGKYEIPVHFVQASSYYSTEVTFENGKPKKRNIRLKDFIDSLNLIQPIQNAASVKLQHNTIVELNGVEYFVIGPSDAMQIRPLYQLEAKDEIKLGVKDYAKLKVIHRNQLGKAVKHGNS